MKISCSLYGSPSLPEYMALAEEIGYDRVWCFDSPAICSDLWVALARGAERTSTIGLASGVLVPRMRHVMTTASAVATVAQLAPGRLTVGIGTGFSASHVLGVKPMRWVDVERYAEALVALLRGEEIEWDGVLTRLRFPEPEGPELPIEVPIVIAADGPRGTACARRLGAGILTALTDPPAGFDPAIKLTFGTVLEPGEPATSSRVYEAAGPAVAMAYHAAYQFEDFAGLARMPNGDAFRIAVDAVPERARHFALHEGHAHHLTDLDRKTVPPELVPALTMTGTADDLRGRLDGMHAAGVTEVNYLPMGRDTARELRAFAEMAVPHERARAAARAVTGA